MLASAEGAAQRRISDAFIAADSALLLVSHRTKVPDGAGGFQFTVDNPDDPAEVVGRMIPQSDKVPEVQGNDGRMARIEYILMCSAGTDVRRYDTFEFKGRLWEVLQIHLGPEYELKADIVLYKETKS